MKRKMNFLKIAKAAPLVFFCGVVVWFVVPFCFQFITYPEPESAAAFRSEFRRDYLPVMLGIGAVIFSISVITGKRPGS